MFCVLILFLFYMSKHRNYAFILYPESSSLSSLIDFFNSSSIPAFISPLHDSDFFSDNSLKKPHYHILINFPYPIELKKLLSLLQPFDILHLDIIYSNYSYYRYLCHLDNPDKTQYNTSDIVLCGGAIPPDNSSSSNTAQKIIELMDIINGQNIGEFSDLIYFLISTNKTDLLEYVSSKSYFVDKIITSKRYKDNRKIIPQAQLVASPERCSGGSKGKALEQLLEL